MSAENLIHVIYTSAATPAFDVADLKPILRAAQIKNAGLSVTGMLLYIKGSFFQVLEGPEETLNGLYARIASDPRHERVTKIIQEPITRREFGAWSMGFIDANPAELDFIEGFNDFFQEGHSLADLQPGRAKKLLSAFAEGRWRSKLNTGAA